MSKKEKRKQSVLSKKEEKIQVGRILFQRPIYEATNVMTKDRYLDIYVIIIN